MAPTMLLLSGHQKVHCVHSKSGMSCLMNTLVVCFTPSTASGVLWAHRTMQAEWLATKLIELDRKFRSSMYISYAIILSDTTWDQLHENKLVHTLELKQHPRPSYRQTDTLARDLSSEISPTALWLLSMKKIAIPSCQGNVFWITYVKCRMMSCFLSW